MTETSTTHDFIDIPSGFDDYDELSSLNDGDDDGGGGGGGGGDSSANDNANANGGGEGGGGGGNDGGLGNLADELAEAWDEDEDEDEDADADADAGEIEGEIGNDDELPRPQTLDEQVSNVAGGVGGVGGRLNELSLHDDTGTGSPIPSKRNKTSATHQRAESRGSPGSPCGGGGGGGDSEFEDAAALAGVLDERINGIEKLSHYPAGQELVARMVQQLRDISGQSKIETNTSRLITAHSSVTAHLAAQTRALQAATQPLLYAAQFTPLAPHDIEAVIPLIDGLIPQLPYPVLHRHRQDEDEGEDEGEVSPQPQQGDAVTSLRALLTQTSDLIHDLRSISDTLHESRQLTSAATRRLRSARELLADIRWDEQVREEGLRFIEKGEWDRRLAQREAKKACGDVVGGFEKVCGEWRMRLFGAAAPPAPPPPPPPEITTVS